MVALLLVAWCGGIPTWHHADVVVGMWWGVVCCGMWEVLWGGGVGLAPVLPCSSSSPGHLLLWSSPPLVISSPGHLLPWSSPLSPQG